MCERAVGNEPFAVLLADDFLISENNDCTQQLLNGFLETGKSQISVMPVNGPDITKYGVLKFDSNNEKIVIL